MANKIFDKISTKRPKMSAFDLSREQKLSCNMGELIPTYLEEVIPGDNFNVKSEIMMRLAPMVSPVMHRVNVYMHYFFVPNRIIWNQWEDFITGGKEGTSDPEFPTTNLNNLAGSNNRLADYLGLPTYQPGPANAEISLLPFRAYQSIWNEYYRDENLQDEADLTNTIDLFELRKRAWEKDYFTSALPNAQRGPEIGMPIDFQYKDTTEFLNSSTDQAYPETTYPGNPANFGMHEGHPDGGSEMYIQSDGEYAATRVENLEGDANITINELRRSNALQRWLEKSMRGGYRYVETILSQFGIKGDDARLQRPEYLGGGQQPVIISEVLNTTGTEELPQGNMSGHGISSGRTNSFNRQFKEHGYVIGIMSVLPKTAYQQGIHKHWNRFDRFEYFWPDFAHLGEQEVKNKEVYFNPNDESYNEETFGYQQRYAEMKYGNSTVHGDFRNDLDYWHMARIFETPPALNEDFVKADPTHRIFAVTNPDEDKLWVQCYHNVKARRPMPYFADPKL